MTEPVSSNNETRNLGVFKETMALPVIDQTEELVTLSHQVMTILMYTVILVQCVSAKLSADEEIGHGSSEDCGVKLRIRKDPLWYHTGATPCIEAK